MNIRHAENLISRAESAYSDGDLIQAARMAAGAQQSALQCRAARASSVAADAAELAMDCVRLILDKSQDHAERSEAGRIAAEVNYVARG